MLISEVSKITNLTKKAIEYYTDQKLVSPIMLENGYRDFSENHVERLKLIFILRRIGLNIEEIREVLADESNEIMKKISVQKKLNIQKEQMKKSILDKLSSGQSYDEVIAELKALEKSLTVAEKLLEAFPGYFGRSICLHFARFLNEPITTTEQEAAYAEIISFLDNMPTLDFPEELQSIITESTKHISADSISDFMEKTKHSIENADKFLSENKEILDQYIAFNQSEEYRNSPLFKMKAMLKEFCQTSGYYDVFIPAMKKLSTSYAKYYEQLEKANEKFISQYPDFAKLIN